MENTKSYIFYTDFDNKIFLAKDIHDLPDYRCIEVFIPVSSNISGAKIHHLSSDDLRGCLYKLSMIFNLNEAYFAETDEEGLIKQTYYMRFR